MTRPQTNAPDARNAMVAGLLASGISVNGLQPSHNRQVALQMFTTATRLDRDMCDAWLARVLAGDQSIEVLTGAWQSVKTFGWEIRRLGLTELEFRPEISDGMFLKLAVTSVESLAGRAHPISARDHLAPPRAESRRGGDGHHRAGVAWGVRGSVPPRAGRHR